MEVASKQRTPVRDAPKEKIKKAKHVFRRAYNCYKRMGPTGSIVLDLWAPSDAAQLI